MTSQLKGSPSQTPKLNKGPNHASANNISSTVKHKSTKLSFVIKPPEVLERGQDYQALDGMLNHSAEQQDK